MRSLLAIFMGLALSSCQPADPNLRNIRERMDNGEFIEFSKPGYRDPSCRQRQDTLLEIVDEERRRIVLGEQQSFINIFRRTCFEVGSEIGFKKTDQKTKRVTLLPGRAVLKKISWGRLDRIAKSRLKGKFFAATSRYFKYVDGIDFTKKSIGIEEPYVAIFEFKYVNDSAKDQKAVEDDRNKKLENGGYQETLKDGDSICGCRTLYNDFVVSPLYKSEVLSGKMKSWFVLGEEFNFQQGQRAMLKEVPGRQSPSFATVKINKIKKMKLSAMGANNFILDPEFDFKAFELFIDQTNMRLNEDWITIVDFDVVSAGEVTP